MYRKLQAAVVVLCMSSYAGAGSSAIGTVSTRTEVVVDNATIKGNATLFDGSVVQTTKSSAELHTRNGAEITLGINSQGAVYSDHLVLNIGASAVSAPGSFHVDANGLKVTSTAAGSRGVVTVPDGESIEVAALSGSFTVAGGDGQILGSIIPGKPLHFAYAGEVGDCTSKPGGAICNEGAATTLNGKPATCKNVASPGEAPVCKAVADHGGTGNLGTKVIVTTLVGVGVGTGVGYGLFGKSGASK